jgi:hypothetical protein
VWTASTDSSNCTQVGMRGTLLSRDTLKSVSVPRRSLCQRQQFAADESAPKLTVTRYPSSDRDCRHQVFVEHPALTRTLDLPATGHVEVSQEFTVPAGGQLSFRFVVLLRGDEGPRSAQTYASAVLVNLDLRTQVSLVHRSAAIHGNSSNHRVASRSREVVSHTIAMAGTYELRTATSVDVSCSGVGAHLLVDIVRLRFRDRTECKELASICCVGSVRRHEFCGSKQAK